MAASTTVEAASVEATTVEAASVAAVVEVVMVKSAVEVVIVKSAMETAVNKAAEANATVIGRTIVPVRIVPAGIAVVVLVVRHRHDTVCCWRRRSTGSVRCARGGRSASSGSRRRHGRAQGTLRCSVRRRRGGGSGRRRARHRIVAVCRHRRATGKLYCSNHRRGQGRSITCYHTCLSGEPQWANQSQLHRKRAIQTWLPRMARWRRSARVSNETRRECDTDATDVLLRIIVAIGTLGTRGHRRRYRSLVRYSNRRRSRRLFGRGAPATL